jgi:hypothetical protein
MWKWSKDGSFSVKSLYKQLCSNEIDRSFKNLCKAKNSLKIKIWLWPIWYNAIATKDNMTRRNWIGNTKCQLCDEDETIHHLFFTCVAAKYI